MYCIWVQIYAINMMKFYYTYLCKIIYNARFLKVRTYSICWIWPTKSAQISAIPDIRSDIRYKTCTDIRLDIRYKICTDISQTMNMRNLHCTDLAHITHMWDFHQHRPIPHTGHDEFWLYRPVHYYSNMKFHIPDVKTLHGTDLCLITQMWDLFTYRLIPYTGYEIRVHRSVPYDSDVRSI